MVLLRRADQTWFVFEQQGNGVVRRDGQSEVRVADVGHPNPIARKFLQEHPGEYLILYAGINESKLIPIGDESTWLQYRMIEIRTPEDVTEWIALGAALRWLFVGSGRRYGLGVRMEPLAGSGRHTDRFPGASNGRTASPTAAPYRAATFRPTPARTSAGGTNRPGRGTGTATGCTPTTGTPTCGGPP